MVGEKISGGEQSLTPEQRAELERNASEKVQQVMEAIKLREAQIASIKRRSGQSERTRAKSDAEVAKLQGEIDQLRSENGIEAPKSEAEPVIAAAEPTPAPKVEESMSAPVPAPEASGALSQEEIERAMGGGGSAPEPEPEHHSPEPEHHSSEIEYTLGQNGAPSKSTAEAKLNQTILDTVNTGGEFDWKAIRELHGAINDEKAVKDGAGEAAEVEQNARRDEAVHDSEALKAAKEAGYVLAQKEMVNILKGRSIEQAVTEMTADIEHLKTEIELLETMAKNYYNDEEMTQRREHWIAEARQDLASMERRLQMAKNLQEGGAEVVPEAEKPLEEQAAGGELNDNENPLVASAEQVPEIAVISSAAGEGSTKNIPIKVTASEMRDMNVKIEEAEALLGEYRRRYEMSSNPVEKAMFKQSMDSQAKQVENFKARKRRMIVSREAAPAEEEARTPEQEKKSFFERLRTRNGFKRVAQRVKAAVLAVIAGHVMNLTANAMDLTANAADSDIPEETPTEMAGDYEAPAVEDLGVEFDDGAVSLTERQELAEAEVETVKLQSAAKSLVEKFQDEHEGETLDVEKVADHLKQYIEGTGLSLEDVESRFNIADNYVIYCYDEYHGYGDLSNKVTKNAFGTRKAMEFYNNNDVEGGKQNLIDIMTQQPEVLAAQASYFRSAVEKAGLTNIDWSTGAGSLEVARQIDAIFNGENGGEKQLALLNAMKEMLNSEDTTIEYHTKTGVVISQYTMEGDGEDQTGHELNASRKERKDASYMRITHQHQVVYADGSTQIVVEMSDNAQECNNQGDVGNESTPVDVEYTVSTPEPDEPEPELPPEPEPELPPEPGLPPDNGPELPPEPQLPPDENPTPEPVTPPVTPPVNPVTPVTPSETPPETPVEPGKPVEPEKPVEPGKPEPEPDNPEPEPEPEPEPGEPEPEEEIKTKDPDSLIDNANKGGTGTVTQTPGVSEDQLEKEEPEIAEGNQETKEEGAVGDATATEEEQQKNHEAQKDANEKADELEQKAEENGGALTDDEFEDLMDYFNSVAGGTGNSTGGAGEVQS